MGRCAHLLVTERVAILESHPLPRSLSSVDFSRPDSDSAGRATTGLLAWLSAEHHPKLQGPGRPLQEALANPASQCGKGVSGSRSLSRLLVLWRRRDSARGQCVFNTQPPGTCRPYSLLTKTETEREGGTETEGVRGGEREHKQTSGHNS